MWHPDGTSTIDLSGFDKVVKAADKTGIKLLVALTNNWADYGGMDVYTVNLGGQYHDDVRSQMTWISATAPADKSSSTRSLRSRTHSSAMSRRW